MPRKGSIPSKKGYKFECWEIDFPSDDEDTRGISMEAAVMMLMLGWIDVKSDGIITNSYSEKVLSHCYTPTSDDNEVLAYRACADAVFDDMSAEQQHRMIVLWLLCQDYHREHQDDYSDSFREFHYTYFPWAYPGDDADPDEFRTTEPIPQFAVITHDETYSMIVMADTKVEALKEINDRLGQDTLGTNGDVVDLDDTVLSGKHGELGIKHIGTVPYRRLVVSPEVVSLVNGMLETTKALEGNEVWQEARQAFAVEPAVN